MFPEFRFFCFVLAFAEGKSFVHEYLKLLEDKRSRACVYIEEWEEHAEDSEDWMRNMANLVAKLRANKPCRLNYDPSEYSHAVSRFQEYHTDIDGEELIFPSLGDATRDGIHEILEKAIRRNKCVIHFKSEIQKLNPAIYQWKNILHSLKLSKKNMIRAQNLKKGLEPQERLSDLLVFSIFYDQQKRDVINHLLFTEHLTKKCLAKRKIVKPDYRFFYYRLCANRLYSINSSLNLPIEMDNMICSFM